MAHGFGIIGCGMIANFHARAINDIRGAKVVACYDSFPAAADKLAATFGCKRLSRAGQDARRSAGDGRDDRHAQRSAHGAGGGRREGRQARDRRKAAGDHAQALRQDHPGMREGGREALGHLPLAVPRIQPGDQASDRRQPLRPADAGRRLRQVVSHAGLLRQRRLARHLEARRRRRADEPGHPQRRSARPGSWGRSRRSPPARARWPTSGSRSKTWRWPR